MADASIVAPISSTNPARFTNHFRFSNTERFGTILGMHEQIYKAWFFQPNARWPHYVMVDSREIDGDAVNRGHEILNQGGATDDFTPIIFLDKKLDSPELRAQIQADSINKPLR